MNAGKASPLTADLFVRKGEANSVGFRRFSAGAAITAAVVRIVHGWSHPGSILGIVAAFAVVAILAGTWAGTWEISRQGQDATTPTVSDAAGSDRTVSGTAKDSSPASLSADFPADLPADFQADLQALAAKAAPGPAVQAAPLQSRPLQSRPLQSKPLQSKQGLDPAAEAGTKASPGVGARAAIPVALQTRSSAAPATARAAEKGTVKIATRRAGAAKAKGRGGRAKASVPASARSWRLQIHSLKSEGAVRREWARLLKVHRDLFGGLRLTVRRAPKGRFYRMQVGPLADRGAARQFCAKLKRRKMDCLVVGP